MTDEADEPDEEARALAAWLRSHAEHFAPLRIVQVEAVLDADFEGEPMVRRDSTPTTTF